MSSYGPPEPQRLAHEDVTVTVEGEDSPSDQAEQPKPAVTARRQFEPPEGVQIPTMGLPKWKYKFNRTIGRPEKVPALTKKERDIHARKRIEVLKAELIKLARRVKITVYFANMKGGASKTTTAVYFGSILADVTKQVVILVPATHNTSTCTAAYTAGIKPDVNGKLPTLNIQELAKQFKSLPDARDVFALVPPTGYGLRVIAEVDDEADDPELDDEADEKFKTSEFVDVVRKLHQTGEVSLYDGANDSVNRGAIPVEAMHESDVVVFTCTAEIKITIEKLSSTFLRYMRRSSPVKEDEVQPIPAIRTERAIPFLEKVQNSIVTISGVKPDQNYEGVEELEKNLLGAGFKGQFMNIPFDSYMAAHPDNADPNSLDIETYLAYLELIVAVYEQVCKIRETPNLVQA